MSTRRRPFGLQRRSDAPCPLIMDEYHPSEGNALVTCPAVASFQSTTGTSQLKQHFIWKCCFKYVIVVKLAASSRKEELWPLEAPFMNCH
jgi:hypothetical protein